MGCFLLGFGTGAITVVAYQRLRERIATEDYERVSESMDDNLAKLEARLAEEAPAKPSRKSA